MTEATQVSAKKIIGAPLKLYKLSSVSDTNTLTTTFGEVKGAFLSVHDVQEAGLAHYVSHTKSGSVITFETSALCGLDVLVWGE